MDRHYTGFLFYTDDQLTERHASFELSIGPERVSWTFRPPYDTPATLEISSVPVAARLALILDSTVSPPPLRRRNRRSRIRT